MIWSFPLYCWLTNCDDDCVKFAGDGERGKRSACLWQLAECTSDDRAKFDEDGNPARFWGVKKGIGKMGQGPSAVGRRRSRGRREAEEENWALPQTDQVQGVDSIFFCWSLQKWAVQCSLLGGEIFYSVCSCVFQVGFNASAIYSTSKPTYFTGIAFTKERSTVNNVSRKKSQIGYNLKPKSPVHVPEIWRTPISVCLMMSQN